jgi:hypothetical protein
MTAAGGRLYATSEAPMTRHWFEELKFAVEVFDEGGTCSRC